MNDCKHCPCWHRDGDACCYCNTKERHRPLTAVRKSSLLLLALLLTGCFGEPSHVQKLDRCLDRAAMHELPWRTKYEDLCLDAAAIGLTY
jgi:hypothetical protein